MPERTRKSVLLIAGTIRVYTAGINRIHVRKSALFAEFPKNHGAADSHRMAYMMRNPYWTVVYEARL